MTSIDGDAKNNETVQVPSYYRNIGKQTMSEEKGGYAIESLNELELVYFIGTALSDAAKALDSYLIG